MKKNIVIFLSAILLSIASVSLIAQENIKDEEIKRSINGSQVIGDKEIREMSQDYINFTDKEFNLNLTEEQNKKLTDTMFKYVIDFKKVDNLEDAKKLENNFVIDMHEILNKEQTAIIESMDTIKH